MFSGLLVYFQVLYIYPLIFLVVLLLHIDNFRYKITTEKESGVISGVQVMDGGMIQWKRDLPSNCRLSQWVHDSKFESKLYIYYI